MNTFDRILERQEDLRLICSKEQLVDLQRRTGISRARLRRLKENGFKDKPHGLIGTKAHVTVLTGYTSVLI